jgi:hypothetical protein
LFSPHLVEPQETTMNGAAPSPVRVKTLLVAFAVVVALAAFLGMLLGGSGSDGAVQESSDSSYYEGDSQYDEGGSSDSQFYESGSIVRGDDGEYIYSDDNGNSVSFGG